MTVSALMSVLKLMDAPELVVEMEDDEAQLTPLTGVVVHYNSEGAPESVILR